MNIKNGTYYLVTELPIYNLYDIIYYHEYMKDEFLITTEFSNTPQGAFDDLIKDNFITLGTGGESFEEFLKEEFTVLLEFKEIMSYETFLQKHPEVLV